MDNLDFSNFIINENHVLIKYLGDDASVDIPDGIEEIGKGAFSFCDTVERINISTSVRKINHFAFSNCSNLISIIIPDSVEELFMTAFLDCDKLTNIQLPQKLNGSFNMKDDMLVSYTGFEENVVIPPYVDKIGELAFAGCTNTKTISVYKHISHIDRSAFSCCRSLEKIIRLEIKPPLKYSKEDFIIKGQVLEKYIGSSDEVNIPYGVVRIDYNAFANCKHVKQINIPKTVETINNGAFYNCNSLESIIIPEAVTILDERTFNRCKNLRKIILPDNLSYIGRDAFRDCRLLEEINLPQALTCIPEDLFKRCRSLKHITIPKRVKSIGPFAFGNCYGLKNVEFEGKKEEIKIHTNAFYNCPLESF